MEEDSTRGRSYIKPTGPLKQGSAGIVLGAGTLWAGLLGSADGRIHRNSNRWCADHAGLWGRYPAVHARGCMDVAGLVRIYARPLGQAVDRF